MPALSPLKINGVIQLNALSLLMLKITLRASTLPGIRRSSPNQQIIN